MTDVVIPSPDRTARANAESAVNYDGVTERIIPAGNRALELPEENIGSSPLNGFDENGVTEPSGNDFELTIQSGEAFIGGSYVARDTSTTVADDFTSGDRTIAVGWKHDQPDGVVIQPDDQFGSRDRSVDLFTVVDDNGTPEIASDDRKTQAEFERPNIRSSGSMEAGTELVTPSVRPDKIQRRDDTLQLDLGSLINDGTGDNLTVTGLDSQFLSDETLFEVNVDSPHIRLFGSTDYRSGADIQDSGTVAISFDGSANVTVANGHLDVSAGVEQQQRGDPTTSELAIGSCMTYCSDGSGTGAAGDLIYAVNDSGTIKTSIIAERSNATQ